MSVGHEHPSSAEIHQLVQLPFLLGSSKLIVAEVVAFVLHERNMSFVCSEFGSTMYVGMPSVYILREHIFRSPPRIIIIGAGWLGDKTTVASAPQLTFLGSSMITGRAVTIGAVRVTVWVLKFVFLAVVFAARLTFTQFDNLHMLDRGVVAVLATELAASAARLTFRCSVLVTLTARCVALASLYPLDVFHNLSKEWS